MDRLRVAQAWVEARNTVEDRSAAFRATAQRRNERLKELRAGPAGRLIGGAPPFEVGAVGSGEGEGSQQTVAAVYRLQEASDPRAALQSWFGLVAPGGHLIIVVPHAFLYERQLALPSRWNPAQRRLYTPGFLLEEVEEALCPNSYRVRLLCDLDDGYDYRRPIELEPVGESDVLLVLQKREVPGWRLDRPRDVKAAAPDYAFVPSRTRVEVATTCPSRRILVLKLDHVGDFIVAIPVLEKLRALFAGSEITLVVGSWNEQMARSLGVADRVIAFDAFPRNSSEEEVDVPGKTPLFKALITEDYDLAIDLRVDIDARFLLRHVNAALRAGIGTAAQFPFLDIFLPLDFNRNMPETAREYELRHHAFSAQGFVTRNDFRLTAKAGLAERDCAILWGPYQRLRPGRYFFEPYLELAEAAGGMLMLDVALDTQRVAERFVPDPERRLRLPFSVEKPGAAFEFRIWNVEDAPAIDFSFFGGRLVRQGAGSTLHQSEYGALLVELVSLRLERTGMLVDAEPS